MFTIEKKTVSCSTCGHLIYKEEAQIIPGGGTFCREHRVIYERMDEHIYNGYDEHGHYSYKTAYYREMEVSQDGTPIGYVKKTENKELVCCSKSFKNPRGLAIHKSRKHK